MNILFTICARAGSKGVKNKNIRSINGLPLVYYTLAAYKLFVENNKDKYGSIDLAINTDCTELIKQVSQTEIKHFHILRKEPLAGDFVSKIEVIKDTLSEMEEQNKHNIDRYDLIIDLDLTSPLRRDNDIEGVLNKLLENETFDVTFSVAESRRSPYFNIVSQKDDGSCKLAIESEYISRQQAPKCYDMNASIYVYRREFLIEKDPQKVLDGKAACFEMIDTAVLDIDSEHDLELILMLSKFFYESNEAMRKVKDTAEML